MARGTKRRNTNRIDVGAGWVKEDKRGQATFYLDKEALEELLEDGQPNDKGQFIATMFIEKRPENRGPNFKVAYYKPEESRGGRGRNSRRDENFDDDDIPF